MPYAPFYELFPEVAKKETRTLTVLDLADLPRGEYCFMEAYCNEIGCDCRRVFFNVVDVQSGQLMAVIAYGWESQAFYLRWLGYKDPAVIKELQGPALNVASQQSRLAPALLKQMTYILADENYVERLKRHYKMYKAAINHGVGQRAGMPQARPSNRARRRRRT